MIQNSELLGLIQQAANLNRRYTVPYLGRVTSLEDPDGLNRVIVQIPDLGWNTNESAAKCSIVETKGYTVPRLDDYVIVQFIAGNRDLPIILGVANNMKNMIPGEYESGKDVLYSQPDKMHITYDGDQLEIGNTGFQPAARKEDLVKSTTIEDSGFWTWVTAVSGATGVIAVPSSLTSKITSGSNQTQIGDK
jgi:hypothetical protein